MRTADSTDRAAGFDILDDFERFNQKNDVFRRSWWDDEIHSEASALFYATYREPLENFRASDGFTQKDYALRNAAWHVSDIFTELKEKSDDRREGFCDAFTVQREVAAERLEFPSPAAAAEEIKRVARGFGADLVGVTDNDGRWLYTHKFSDNAGGCVSGDGSRVRLCVV